MYRSRCAVLGGFGWLLILLSSGRGAAVADDRAGAARGEPAAMVVIGPERFHKAMAPYLAYRRAQRPTEWASLESVLKQSQGADDPERLKRWLYRAWRERHVRYVLLVGDADVVPVRYMVLDRVTPSAFDYAFYPSDLYYADVARRDGSFDDWNAMKDGFHAGYFGEVRGEKNKSDPINFDRIDYRAELAVGRWPVDTEAEVATVAEKTMREDRAAVSGRGPGLRRAGLVYVPGWVDARGRMDDWAKRLPTGWTTSRLYGDRPRSPAGDAHHVAMLMNEGASILLHVGHGEANGWAGSLDVGALRRLHNADRLPVVLSAGCSTAAFATLPPYEAYEDVHGAKHKGTNAGEHFDAPPPSPSPYARRGLQPDRPGRDIGPPRAERGRGLHRLQHGRPAVRHHAAGGIRRRAGRPARADARRLLGPRHRPLLRRRAPGVAPAERRLVSAEHLLPGDEVHGLRRPGAAAAGGGPLTFTRP